LPGGEDFRPADFDRDLAPVLAHGEQVAPGTHPALRWIHQIAAAIVHVTHAKPLRQENLDGATDQLGA